VTYYTCDDCDWAGPFAEARKHYKETSHDAFSRRDETDAVATQPVVIEQHHHYTPRPLVRPLVCLDVNIAAHALPEVRDVVCQDYALHDHGERIY
jgi:hypothetical protein